MAPMAPVVSKLYCSPSQANFIVRRRPRVINGGGFVVTNNNSQKVVFKVDGCGILGVEGELVLKDSDGESLLLIRRKGGIVQALCINRQWKGYKINFEGDEKLVFTLKEPVSYIVKKIPVKIMVEPRCNKDWDFEVKGSFQDRACSIVDSKGNIVAQVVVNNELEEMRLSKDLYHVVVQPGYDQAFVFGVIAVLDNIHNESTVC
ncbi:Lurp-one-like protein [Thalictrum thalictroides]|uniref:Lurp-one-like protein n=1 Tax=Thalictrum thalictroides TaxID=46969 RepID=A0A7J6WG18_THATH|nr:Lurp-one-like protein [Thalictrum thalictroides]